MGLLNNTEVRVYHMYRPTSIYEPGWDHGRAAGPQNLQRCILTHTRVGPQRQTVSMSKAPAGPPAYHLARCTTLEWACTITLGPGYIHVQACRHSQTRVITDLRAYQPCGGRELACLRMQTGIITKLQIRQPCGGAY